MNYLRSDFKIVSGVLEKAMIDLSYQDFLRDGFYEGIKNAAQDNMIDPYNL